MIIVGIIESKPNACHVLKSTLNKKPQNKGPFLANVPLQQMVQNYEDQDTKEIIHAPTSPRGQVCSYLSMKHYIFNIFL